MDEIYALEDGMWGDRIEDRGQMPQMRQAGTSEADYGLGEIPAVKGMGLRDAIYTIENCGYTCTFEGTGHVPGQNPAPGTKADKGKNVHIILE